MVEVSDLSDPTQVDASPRSVRRPPRREMSHLPTSGAFAFGTRLLLLNRGRVAGRHWSLVAGRWSLVAGRWSLVAARVGSLVAARVAALVVAALVVAALVVARWLLGRFEKVASR
jgi:hypothetical protein